MNRFRPHLPCVDRAGPVDAARRHLQHPQGRARRRARASGWRSTTSAWPSRRSTPTWCSCRKCGCSTAATRGASSAPGSAGPKEARPSSWRPKATRSPTAAMPSRAAASTAMRCCRAGRSATSAITTSATTASSSAACCTCRCTGTAHRVHAVVVHFGLTHRSRVRQVQRLADFIAADVPADELLVVAGDFNDWGERLDAPMRDSACSARCAGGRAAQRRPFRRWCRCSRSTASTCAA